MRGLGPLLRKEILGLHRTFRLWVALVICLLIGLGSPLLAKGIPTLLAHLPEDQMRGIEILLLKAPDLTDALAQYHKNMSLLPLVVVLLGMGSIPAERPATAALVLSRPASRGAFLASKALALAGLLVVGIGVAAAGCTLYTRVLFGPMDLPAFLALNGCYLLFDLFIGALTLLGGVLGRGQGLAAALGLGGFLGLSALAAFPSVAVWTPAGLMVAAGDLVSGQVPNGASAGVTVLGIALVLGVAGRVFQRQAV